MYIKWVSVTYLETSHLSHTVLKYLPSPRNKNIPHKLLKIKCLNTPIKYDNVIRVNTSALAGVHISDTAGMAVTNVGRNCGPTLLQVHVHLFVSKPLNIF